MPFERIIGLLVVGTVALVVAAGVLPRLVVPVTVIVGLFLIGRLVHYITRQ
jgi:hypothetical protein